MKAMHTHAFRNSLSWRYATDIPSSVTERKLSFEMLQRNNFFRIIIPALQQGQFGIGWLVRPYVESRSSEMNPQKSIGSPTIGYAWRTSIGRHQMPTYFSLIFAHTIKSFNKITTTTKYIYRAVRDGESGHRAHAAEFTSWRERGLHTELLWVSAT